MSRYARHNPDEEVVHDFFANLGGAVVVNPAYPNAPGFKTCGTSEQAAKSVETESGFDEAAIRKTLEHVVRCSNGYRKCKASWHPFVGKSGYVREHRLVAELREGRYLDPKVYDIHHIDGNHANNHPDNLEILTRREHLRRHRGIWNQVDGIWFKYCPKCETSRAESDFKTYSRKRDGTICISAKCPTCNLEDQARYNRSEAGRARLLRYYEKQKTGRTRPNRESGLSANEWRIA